MVVLLCPLLCVRARCKSLWMIYSPPSSAPAVQYLWPSNTSSTCWTNRHCSITSLILRPSTYGRPTGNLPPAAGYTRLGWMPHCWLTSPTTEIVYVSNEDDHKTVIYTRLSPNHCLHMVSTNSLPLRFWINILKNPQFIFDVQNSDHVDAVLSVIAQTFMDSCTIADHKLGRVSWSTTELMRSRSNLLTVT